MDRVVVVDNDDDDDDDVCGPTSSTNIVYIFWEGGERENQNVSPVPNVVDLFVIYVCV